MQKVIKISNNAGEANISTLLSGDNIFSIPYFQRPYKWKSKRIKQLNKDILSIVDESTDIHFLGAIIVHGRPANPSDPKIFEVIDGHQRITTLFLYLSAIVKALSDNGEYNEAVGIFLKYLAIGREVPTLSNSKLHSCKEDRAQLNSVFRKLMKDKPFTEKLCGFNY